MKLSSIINDLETGVKKIDNQHKRMINYLENIYELSKKINFYEENEDQKKRIELFLNYLFEHMNEEESLMIEAEYPETQEHISEHNKIKKDLTEIVNYNKDSLVSLIFSIYDYFKEKYLEHILYYDKRLGKFLNQEKEKK